MEHHPRAVLSAAIHIAEAPHMVNLRHLLTPVCGASIISGRHCLTAAQCFEEGTEARQYSIVVGDSSIAGRDQSAFSTRVNRFIVHEEYNAQTKRNDIAVLLLENPLPLNDLTIVAIELPPFNARVPFGSNGTVTGW